MDQVLGRGDLDEGAVRLADLLLGRLKLRGRLAAEEGRVEIVYKGGAHLAKLFVHEGFSRTELAELDTSTS